MDDKGLNQNAVEGRAMDQDEFKRQVERQDKILRALVSHLWDAKIISSQRETELLEYLTDGDLGEEI